jgi:hypothetical protein
MRKSFFAATCMAVLISAAPALHANTIFGSSWSVDLNNPTYNDSVPAAGDPLYSSTPTASFIISGTPPLLQFSAPNPGETLNDFLTSAPGETLTYTHGDGSTPLVIPYNCHPDCKTDTVIQFTGFVDLTAGTYSITHDDGVLLYLDGSLALDAGGPSLPTYPVTSTFTVASSGLYSFTLDYAQCCGNPATLITDLPLGASAPTPEPASFILLGSGLLAAAGVVRRRLTA